MKLYSNFALNYTLIEDFLRNNVAIEILLKQRSKTWRKDNVREGEDKHADKVKLGGDRILLNMLRDSNGATTSRVEGGNE